MIPIVDTPRNTTSNSESSCASVMIDNALIIGVMNNLTASLNNGLFSSKTIR